MSRVFLKIIALSSCLLLCWMCLSAFHRHSAPIEIDQYSESDWSAQDSKSSTEISLESGQSGDSAQLTTTIKPENNETPIPKVSAEKKPAGSLAELHSQHQADAAKISIPTPFIKKRRAALNRPIRVDGLGRPMLDWEILASTPLDRKGQPEFPTNLKIADGKEVTLSGFMSPLDEVGQMHSFLLLEYPLGCFYCLTPDPTNIVIVELLEGSHTTLTTNLVKVSGRLRLNDTDPEDFIYIITDAEISPAE